MCYNNTMRIKFELIFILVLIIMSIPVSALTLSGGISYTTETAKSIAFENVDIFINMNKYNAYLRDCFHNENIKNFKKGKYKYRNRRITLFNNSDYSVNYKKNKKISYYYNSSGELQYVSFSTLGKYPRKTLKYSINGKLDSIALSIAPREQYVFDINKRLVAHWIGDNGYNEKGELIAKRKSQ